MSRGGKRGLIVKDVADRLSQGYRPSIVGGTPLRGVTPTIIEVDGQPLMVPSKAFAQDGLLLTSPDGYTVLYATVSRANAERLLADARAASGGAV